MTASSIARLSIILALAATTGCGQKQKGPGGPPPGCIWR